MELDLPSNFNNVVLNGMDSAAKLWSSGQKSRLVIGPVKLQSALSQLKPSMFSEGKYEEMNFLYTSPIGGIAYLQVI